VNSPVIEPVDVFKGLPLHVFDVAPGSLAVNELILVETVEGFSEGIVVAVALGSNRGDNVGAAESLGVANT
jgi:hypothetical protein